MAKTIVYKKSSGDQTPFLRGILTQSLVNIGLPFEDAYKLAQTIRTDLKDVDNITTLELQNRVAHLVQEMFGQELSTRYKMRSTASGIIVHTPTRSETFSLSTLTHSLVAYSFDRSEAIDSAKKIYSTLKNTGHTEIDHKALRRVVYRCIREHCSEDSANRYLSWRRFENSGIPLILLIGGITGSGKSTLSTELGYRLNISRMQSTDMIREIVRAYLATAVAPTLQYSTFEAWRGLPALELDKKSELETPVITGFLSQLMALKPALNSVIDRALKEKEHLIIEGVHALCTELDLEAIKKQALVVPIVVATLEKKALKKRLIRRGREQKQRKAERYIENIDEIWELQSYLLDLTDHAGIPIINNTTIEDTINEIHKIISAKIIKRFPAHPEPLDGETL